MAETQTRDLINRLLDYKVVQLDGRSYEVRNQDMVSILDFRWLALKQSRLQELWEKDPPTVEDSAEFSAILERCCRIVLSAPEDVLQSLNDFHRKQVLDFFLQSSTATQPASATKSGLTTARKPRGRNSSRA